MREKGLISFILAAALFVLSSGASAAEEQWKFLWANDKGERVLYDAASVVYFSRDEVQVRIKELSREPLSKLEEINCAYKIYRDREVVSERPGRTRPAMFPSRWQPVEKSPAMKELHKAVCK